MAGNCFLVIFLYNPYLYHAHPDHPLLDHTLLDHTLLDHLHRDYPHLDNPHLYHAHPDHPLLDHPLLDHTLLNHTLLDQLHHDYPHLDNPHLGHPHLDPPHPDPPHPDLDPCPNAPPPGLQTGLSPLKQGDPPLRLDLHYGLSRWAPAGHHVQPSWPGSLSPHWTISPAPHLAIDYDKLKIQEKILFFDDVRLLSGTSPGPQVVLYEDELDDNGCAKLSVKMRAMPSGDQTIEVQPAGHCRFLHPAPVLPES